MKFIVFSALILCISCIKPAQGSFFSFGKPNPPAEFFGSSIFDFTVHDSNGPIEMSLFRGKKAYLLVNVASECGLTQRTYEELIALNEKYVDLGLQILAFPCNDFGAQEPGENEEIVSWAMSKGVQFPVLGKVTC